MIKRVIAYTVNILILIIPILIMYLYMGEYFFKWALTGEAGVAIFEVIIQILFPPYLLTLVLDKSLKVVHFIIPLIGLTELIMLDSLLSFVFQGDLGKKVFELKIVSSQGERVNFMQILARTTVKYCTLVFIPIVLIYPLFSKDNRALHDIVAKTKVINS